MSIMNGASGNNKKLYKSFCFVIRRLLEKGFVIYGGAVRDLARHEYAAKTFYEKFLKCSYENKTVAPELLDRFLIPSDIDLYHPDVYAKQTLFDLMDSIGFKDDHAFTKASNRKNRYSSAREFNQGKYKFDCVFSDLSIHIDITYPDKVRQHVFEPEHISEPDFICNSLYIATDSKRVYLDYIIQNRAYKTILKDVSVDEILKQISEKKAVCIECPRRTLRMFNRAEKMHKKGWSIENCTISFAKKMISYKYKNHQFDGSDAKYMIDYAKRFMPGVIKFTPEVKQDIGDELEFDFDIDKSTSILDIKHAAWKLKAVTKFVATKSVHCKSKKCENGDTEIMFVELKDDINPCRIKILYDSDNKLKKITEHTTV